MIEFLFFQKIIIENNIDKDFKEFLSLVDEQDEFEWDESHFDGRTLERKRTVTWLDPETKDVKMNDGQPEQTTFKSEDSFIKYLKRFKYENENNGMIPSVRRRLDEYLMNDTKRKKYIQHLRKKYLDILESGDKNNIFSTYLDIDDYFKSFTSELELIIGEPLSPKINSPETSNNGLNLGLNESQISLLKKLYHFAPENHYIVDKLKSSEETFISAFNEKWVDGNLYFLCKTKDLAYIIDCLYYHFELSQSKRQFFKSIQDSGIFITNTGKILTASNISKNISIGASPFKTHLDTFFKTVK